MGSRRLIVGHDLIERLSKKLGLSLTALGSLTGAQLAGCQYTHPLFDRTSPVVIGGDYITTESGTGLVHTAPGHGQEDYQVTLLDKHRLSHSLGVIAREGERGSRARNTHSFINVSQKCLSSSACVIYLLGIWLEGCWQPAAHEVHCHERMFICTAHDGVCSESQQWPTEVRAAIGLSAALASCVDSQL